MIKSKMTRNQLRALKVEQDIEQAQSDNPSMKGLPFNRQRGQRGLIRAKCECGGIFEQWYALCRTGRSSIRKALRVRRCTKCGKLEKHDHRPDVTPQGKKTMMWQRWDGIGQEIKEK